jgi:NAD-dependent SIR2 family protein deacetylase
VNIGGSLAYDRVVSAYLSQAPGVLKFRNTVFLLGAGASYDHGYPLVREFVNPKYLAWLHDQWVGLPGVFCDWPQRRAEAEEFRKISDNFEVVLSTAFETPDLYQRVLDYAWWLFGAAADIAHSSVFITTAEYYGLAGLLVEMNHAGRCSVVSFNYDTTVEDAVSSLSRNLIDRGLAKYPGLTNDLLFFNYGFQGPVLDLYPEALTFSLVGTNLPNAYPKGGVRVLKLHGSVTTLGCLKCGAVHYAPVEMLSRNFAELPAECRACGDRSLQAMIVPPGKRKKIPASFDDLWTAAADDIASSDVVVIAGYSMPEYDVEARSMLEIPLRNKNVILVDPSPNDSAIAFLSSTANARLHIVRQTIGPFLREEVNAFAPGSIAKIRDLCAPQRLYADRMTGCLRN